MKNFFVKIYYGVGVPKCKWFFSGEIVVQLGSKVRFCSSSLLGGGCPVGLVGEERSDNPTGVPTNNNVAKRPYCIYPRVRLRAKGGIHAPYLAKFPLFYQEFE